MKEVARTAGVSIQTVSAILNDKPGITDATRDRVLSAVHTLGYRPYSIARSLRTRKTYTLALVVSDIANPSFATMASAAEEWPSWSAIASWCSTPMTTPTVNRTIFRPQSNVGLTE